MTAANQKKAKLPCVKALSTRFSEVEEEKITEIIGAAIPENTKRIMQVSGHRNEGRVKVYCERQTLQQQNSAFKFWRRQLHPRRR